MKKWKREEMSFQDWVRNNIAELRLFLMGKRMELRQLRTVFQELGLDFDFQNQFDVYGSEFTYGSEDCMLLVQYRLVHYNRPDPLYSTLAIRTIICRITDYIEPDPGIASEELETWNHREVEFTDWIRQNLGHLRAELVGKHMSASELDQMMMRLNIGCGVTVNLRRHMSAFAFGMLDDTVSIRFRVTHFYEDFPGSSMLEISSVVGKRVRYVLREEDFVALNK